MKKRILIMLAAVLALAGLVVGAAVPAQAESEPQKNGDVLVFFTSDVHCGIDQGFGYGGLAQIRAAMEAKGYTTLLVDDGDAVQGDVVGTVTKGAGIINLMNAAGYDVAIPGNHEFDYGMDAFFAVTEQANFPYISCNFRKDGEPVFDPYVIIEAAGKKIAFVGVTTPKSITSSTPKYFQDDAGNFIYDFCQDSTGEMLYQAVQSAADNARAEGADYVIVMGHIGNEEACAPWTYADIISNTQGIDAFLDGHSHDTDHVIMNNMNGEEVLRAACGTKLDSIGWLKISADDSSIESGLYTWDFDVPAVELFNISNPVVDAVAAVKAELDTSLSQVVAQNETLLTINDPVEKDSSGTPIRMVRRAETNLGDFCADAYRVQLGTDIGLSNGGGVRTNIVAGEVTMADILRVHPFNNEMYVLTATGQQIINALEWGARAVPKESGSFLQVSGLTYEIDTSIESSCTSNEDGMCTGVAGEYRVRNVCVGGEPIDPEATYTVGASAYILLLNGDGYTAFDGCEGYYAGRLDNQVLIDYIQETLGGRIGEAYADPCGEGRIVIK